MGKIKEAAQEGSCFKNPDHRSPHLEGDIGVHIERKRGEIRDGAMCRNVQSTPCRENSKYRT